MKKLFFIMAMSVCAFMAQAQTTSGIRVGLNMTSMSNVEESKMHPGFYAGMGAGYVIDETWSVRPSLLFTMKGVKQNYKF